MRVLAARVVAGSMSPMDLAVWAHRRFGHGTLELAERLVELDDAYDCIEDTDMTSLAENEKVRALVQEAVDLVNSKVARVEEVKKFKILAHDLTQETGELTPTLKVKRNIVYDKYAGELDALYKK